jgi:hypothetical protein
MCVEEVEFAKKIYLYYILCNVNEKHSETRI